MSRSAGAAWRWSSAPTIPAWSGGAPRKNWAPHLPPAGGFARPSFREHAAPGAGEGNQSKGIGQSGAVTVRAWREKELVCLEVADDGRGIDTAKIGSRAVARALVSEAQLKGLRERDILEFICYPGFSTAEVVTETSGRGVGMDVVRKNVSKLSGMIDIETEPGAGSKFMLTLPITLAIIKALIVEAGGQVFAVPLSSVLEIIQTTEKQVETVETREVMAIRDETVPLLRLTQVFKLPPKAEGDSLYLILVGLAERRLGIVVDGLRDQQEIVIKPLGKRLADLPGIAGATELGDQRGVVLVLDVESLIEGAMKKAAVRSQ